MGIVYFILFVDHTDGKLTLADVCCLQLLLLTEFAMRNMKILLDKNICRNFSEKHRDIGISYSNNLKYGKIGIEFKS